VPEIFKIVTDLILDYIHDLILSLNIVIVNQFSLNCTHA